MRLLEKITSRIAHRPYFGFVHGHSYLSDEQVNHVLSTLNEISSGDLTENYERAFSELVGSGSAISFAAARMAFFALMKHLTIGKGDEVLLTGYTCAVMANAVFKTGAQPTFSDIDARTFGSSASSIERSITKRTKMVVAQHSFGIPCEINLIAEICKSRRIFLLEDCSITLDSRFKTIAVGNWGDAAIFSTDHSKPINTMVGGILYSKNRRLISDVRKTNISNANLDGNQQLNLYNELLFERKYCNPSNQHLVSIHRQIRDKFKLPSKKTRSYTYLTADYSRISETLPNVYPYPARMPEFLALVGLFEIERWPAEKKKRISLLNDFISAAENIDCMEWLPSCYLDSNLAIVPSRFVFNSKNVDYFRNKMKGFVDTNWFWFQSPIIGCNDPAELGYIWNSCPVAEKMSQEIINFPCIADHAHDGFLVGLFEDLLLDLKNRAGKARNIKTLP